MMKHFQHVKAGLLNRRDLLVLLHPGLPGIIGGQCKREVPIEAVQQMPQIFGATCDIIDRVEGVANP